ncbi:MAG: hypothetical protein COC12_08415 [Rhodobacteraceae bacterium]|nr:MAG: hypothetical protein COC12_08415 [Paracoccaceae bacterium]
MIRAIHFTDLAEMREKRLAGSIYAGKPDDDGEIAFWYCCPCGCGLIAPLNAGRNFKPSGAGASWNWNGSQTEASLIPSVNHVGHWHGWLTDGYWKAV